MTVAFPAAIPAVIGHRGAAAVAPENTLASIRAAVRAGAAMVEVDAKLSADGAVILMHDDSLDRTTSGSGPVRSMAYAALSRLDAGGWFGPDFAGESIPTLTDALALVQEVGIDINIEVKPCPGRDAETAAAVLEVIADRWRQPMPPLLSSFSVEALMTLRRLAPALPRGLAIDVPPADWSDIAARVEAATLTVNPDAASDATMADFLASGRPVLAYTVNDPAQAAMLWGKGVAAVFTDDPGRIAGVRASASAVGGPGIL